MDDATAQASRIDGYAAALLDVARAEGDTGGLTDEIYRAGHALAGNSELIDVLADARVPAERKQGIIDDLLGKRASRVTVAAINFVVAAGQARHLSDIATRLADLAAEVEGEVVAEVRAPMELDAEQIERLTAALSSATGRRVQVKVVIDPTVLGGLVAKVGDTVLDGSVQNRLDELREQWG
ncbi:MAG: ATP synthase F1 subunit delta [Actinomycetota bacterium]|nr:ATP synthase F1 subunit delta [Actinomycetota bacterium]